MLLARRATVCYFVGGCLIKSFFSKKYFESNNYNLSLPSLVCAQHLPGQLQSLGSLVVQNFAVIFVISHSPLSLFLLFHYDRRHTMLLIKKATLSVAFALLFGSTEALFKPIAYPDYSATMEGQPVNINVLANDRDRFFSKSLKVKSVAPPDNGTISVNHSTGIVTYIPDAGFVGVDSFGYRAVDSQVDLVSNWATVTVNVKPAPTPPPPTGGKMLGRRHRKTMEEPQEAVVHTTAGDRATKNVRRLGGKMSRKLQEQEPQPSLVLRRVE